MKRSDTTIAEVTAQKGASLIEYCLLIALIVLVSLASIQAVGLQIADRYAFISYSLDDGGGTEEGRPGPNFPH